MDNIPTDPNNPIDLSESLSQSLLNIYKDGIANCQVSLGHILLLHDMGYLDNKDEEANYISSMHISELGLKLLKRKYSIW